MNHIRTFIIYAVATLILLLNAAEVSAQKSYSVPNAGRVDMDKLVGRSDIEKLSKLPDGFDAAADTTWWRVGTPWSRRPGSSFPPTRSS